MDYKTDRSGVYIWHKTETVISLSLLCSFVQQGVAPRAIRSAALALAFEAALHAAGHFALFLEALSADADAAEDPEDEGDADGDTTDDSTKTRLGVHAETGSIYEESVVVNRTEINVDTVVADAKAAKSAFEFQNANVLDFIWNSGTLNAVEVWD